MFRKTATRNTRGNTLKRGLKIETEKGHRDKPRGQFKGKKKRERTSKIGGLNLSPFTGPRAS